MQVERSLSGPLRWGVALVVAVAVVAALASAVVDGRRPVDAGTEPVVVEVPSADVG